MSENAKDVLVWLARASVVIAGIIFVVVST